LHVCQTQAKNSKENGKTLPLAGKRFSDYLSDFQDVFQVGKKNVLAKAIDYTKSIWGSRLSNIEKLTETGLTGSYHSLQHFISDSPWDHRELMGATSKKVSNFIPQNKLTGLSIDETGVRKKGRYSVGLGRQYLGSIGKVDNGQVAVCASLGCGDFATIIDSRLYLPESWTEDKNRMAKAKIPKENQSFKTKQQLALEIIKHQMTLETKFDYINADALYGADQGFTDAVDAMAIPFVMDVRENQQVYLEEPRIHIPERKGKRGRQPSIPKPDVVPISVNEYAKGLEDKAFRLLKVRNTAKGKLKCLFHFKIVFIWDGKSPKASKRLLVIRKSFNKKKVEMKYSLGNVDLVQYTPEAIAYMQAQRFFIEHAFKEAKSVLGLNQFQTRKWIAWHHQIALNMLLLLFIFKEKLFNFDTIPLLSAWDIKQVISVITTSSPERLDRLIVQIFERHKIRQRDINRYYSST
jgi:SRSO17 transposase